MMKRMTALLLAAITVLPLAACGASESNQTGNDTSQAEATTAEPTSTEPTANVETKHSNDVPE